MASELHLQIDGMHCEACVRRVSNVLERVPGIHVRRVKIGTATVQAEAGVNAASLLDALDRGGFGATLQDSAS